MHIYLHETTPCKIFWSKTINPKAPDQLGPKKVFLDLVSPGPGSWSGRFWINHFEPTLGQKFLHRTFWIMHDQPRGQSRDCTHDKNHVVDHVIYHIWNRNLLTLKIYQNIGKKFSFFQNVLCLIVFFREIFWKISKLRIKLKIPGLSFWVLKKIKGKIFLVELRETIKLRKFNVSTLLYHMTNCMKIDNY